MRVFRFTFNRTGPRGITIENIVDTISAYTMKSAKHALVKRFGLQNWSPWRQTRTGTFVKNYTRDGDRGKITVEGE